MLGTLERVFTTWFAVIWGLQLADFGVSRMLVNTSRTFMGTPLFMSPEILNGEPYQLASDMYSLGSVIYFLCMGKHPHTASSLQSLRVSTGEP